MTHMRFFVKIFLPICLSWLVAMGAVGQSQPQPTSVQNSALSQTESATDWAELVNPLMGTDSEPLLSHGNTYPAIALPWGMHFWTPQTGKMRDGWAYSYDATRLRGIKQTHQPSPWINDYGAFSLMAVTGKLRFTEEARQSWFSHKAEKARPYEYAVYLADYDVTAEVTPTERAAQFRFTFPQTDSAFLILDAFDGGSQVKVIPAERKIVGYSRNHSGGVPSNFHNYFVLVFDQDFTVFHTFSGDTLHRGSTDRTGKHVGAVVGFRTRKGQRVGVKVASSFVSLEQAERNLAREVGADAYETTREKAHRAWNRELGRFQVEGGSEAQRSTFYSCLYRVLLFPRPLHEFDAQGKMIHYSPYNGKIEAGYLYTDNGFWDTFRAVFPFFTLFYPTLNSQIMQGLANTYRESGWLPEWASPGHRDCMIGSNSASLIADAYLKGIRGFDINLLYEAMLKNTKSVGPVNSVGRYGADHYNRLGYVPYDVGINENAARTLEYAYADFCLWKLAQKLGRTQLEISTFAKRHQNYRNLLDPETKLMRGRNKDGAFQAPFNPFKWGDAFTEGNSWHYTWSVFHDIDGLAQLMGGHKAFAAKLDTVFNLPPIFDESYYGFVIHEIREMQIMDMGQYAHGNQPIQHMPYLYNYCGQPWKTQFRVRQIMDKLYSATPDGYCGDEDNGQTSAWYVFSAMGFYPVCPGTDQYVLGSPAFPKMTVRMEDGKTLVIEAPDNAPGRPYVDKLLFNNQELMDNYLIHSDLQKGGRLIFQLSAQPNTQRGTLPAHFPYSISKP